MSEINKVAATREEMEKAAEALHAEFVGRGAAACEYIESLFKDAVFARMGARGENMKVKCTDCECFKLCVVADGRDDRYTIDLYFDKCFGKTERKLRMSVGGYGSFDNTEKPFVALYWLAGKVASMLNTLEHMMATEIDWDEFDKARNAYYDATSALYKFDDAQEREARNAAIAEAAKQIVPGAIIKRTSAYYEPELDVVEEVKNKIGYTRRLFKDGDKLTKGYRSQFKIANLAQDILDKRVTVEGKMAV